MDKFQKLFNYFQKERGLTLMESELREVIQIADEILKGHD